MSEQSRLAWIVALSLLSFGCKSGKSGDGLPPPSGSGTPPPEIPSLASASAAGADDDSAAGDRHFSGTGSLVAEHRAELGPKFGGVIAKIAVDEGDTVKKGQLLFRMDSAQAQIAARQAAAAVAAAKVGLDAAELEYKRTKELFDRGSVPPATFDQVKAHHDAAQANLDQAKAALSMAGRNAADAAVRSPIDGVITAKLRSEGETASMMPPTVIVVVQDLDSLELRARLPERSLQGIKAGDSVKMHLPATGEDRTVSIKRVNPAVDPRTRTVEIVCSVPNKERTLKPGMLAEVSYELPAAAAAPPASAATPAKEAKRP